MFFPILSCKQDKGLARKTIVEHVNLEESEDDVEPPPHDLTPNFNNVKDWLSKVCDAENPQKPIKCYSLGIYESGSEDTTVVYLVGLNYYGNHTSIDFESSNMYFLLPKDYHGLSLDQLSQKLTSELKDFTKSKKFESSFLAKTQKIILHGNIVIWSSSDSTDIHWNSSWRLKRLANGSSPEGYFGDSFHLQVFRVLFTFQFRFSVSWVVKATSIVYLREK